MQEAYIVAGFRTAVGKAPRGRLRTVRPDDMAVAVIEKIKATLPQINFAQEIDDLICGNAIPEAEQGLNMARYIALRAVGKEIPAVTINRYCASGLEAIAMAVSKIRTGDADAILAGGTETMSLVPMGGYKIVPNYEYALHAPDWYYGMGMTAEEVAKKYEISREAADEFALRSHQRAIAAIQAGKFKDEIVPLTVKEVVVENGKKQSRTYIHDTDEGPRADTSLEALARLKPVFSANGRVTAGNSSQTSDGAAFVLVVSENFLKRHNLTPIAVMRGYAVAGVEPRIMGIGPVEAIPKALRRAGLSLADIDLIELNEAFAAQSLAVIQQAELPMDKLNVNGGAIALGHPLGCSGAKLTVQVLNELRRQGGKYGMVTACVGGGQGIAGIFERLN
ncbi:MAG: acetyl-CoA C-acyltransferase [Bacteroidia bacterium]|nr:acetyl-CoA C-acyltransferase [Bacteroidia bacterium]MCX7651607.1 acetyl-CoA C-acyltransferase [Bacteroidia bacterium]MDW8417308.1 acetyl-CoA C-acyltransferase [Bacteroidia bacterium]